MRYHAEVDRCWSNGMSIWRPAGINTGFLRPAFQGDSRSSKVIRIDRVHATAS